MNRKYISIIAFTTLLTACGDGGNKFEGKWSCSDKDLGGEININIRNNGSNNYIIEEDIHTNNHFMNFNDSKKFGASYKDGKLIASVGIEFYIDSNSGKLIGPGMCEMTKQK